MDKKRIDVGAHLKKVQLLNPSLPFSQQGGFRCEVCQASFKNHDSYLDHTNSRVHLLNIGIEKAEVLKAPDVGSVKARLEALKKKKEASKATPQNPVDLMEKRIEAAKISAERKRQEKYAKRKAARKRKASELDE